MQAFRTAAVAILASVVIAVALPAAGTLDIWFIDVEGGQATLLVTPAGESMLIDAGYSPRNWRGAIPASPNGRDPGRILDVIQRAGVSRLDYVLVTHFHPDHVGGVPDVVAKIPVGTFIDYGSPASDDASTLNWFRNYEPARRTGRHVVARAGDNIPLAGMTAQIVSAAGAVISTPLGEGGGANAECVDVEDHPEDGTENFRSVGVVFRFGAFRFLDLGDLSGNTLTSLACPRDMLGPMSAYLVAHHGDYDSNVPALYAALRPRVVIMNNGVTRGGSPEAFATVSAQRAIEDLWQLHFSENNGARNAPDSFIANVDEGVTGHALHLTAFEDGSFRIVNERTGFTKHYQTP